MHTVMVMGGGFLLLAICALVGRGQGAIGTGALWFLPLWAAAVLVNMWFGVMRAGYGIAEETPIALVLFAVPAAVALFLWWKFQAA